MTSLTTATRKTPTTSEALSVSPPSPQKPVLAIIGGSGLYSLQPDGNAATQAVVTPYSDLPVTLYRELFSRAVVWFLPRHGVDHTLAPHLINYRANLYALREAGATHIVAVNAVGGITDELPVGSLALPDQLIDYTWGRDHTFNTGPDVFDSHVDFTHPYDAGLCDLLMNSAGAAGIDVHRGGVYGCTQGPRLETAAEIVRMRRDGCDMVGMTGMPEAALARELQLPYASIALVVNKAAGLDENRISIELMRTELDRGVGRIRALLLEAMANFAAQSVRPG